MAIYHYTSRIIKRSARRSSVAAAAYRAGERLRDKRTGDLYDYTHRREFIESWIQAPEGAPAWVHDRGKLWNVVERTERRRDAQLSREFELALPVELTHDQQHELLRGFVSEELVSRGMIADVCVHRHKEGNPHAHIMLSMREIGPERETGPKRFGNKQRDWNSDALYSRWRERWADHTNERLREVGRPERVDHRSYKEQGIDREPTVHEGPGVRAMEDRGLRTDRGDENRAVHRRNEERDREREHRQAEPEPAREHRPSRRRGPIRGPGRGDEDRGPDRDFF